MWIIRVQPSSLPSASIDRRAVERAGAVALEQVEDDDHAVFGGLGLEGLGDRAGHRFGEAGEVGACRPLRIEPLEGQLGEADEPRAVGGGDVDGLEAGGDVGLLVRCGALLDEGDLHGGILALPVQR